MTATRRAVALVAALVAVAGTGLDGGSAAPGAAAPTAGPCTDGTGITVVVDHRELGGGLVTRCAPGPWGASDTGFTVLDRAGFQVQRVQRFPGALCRIDGQPTPQQDACVQMPPATAYWSYWLAQRGGEWCYSNLGAGNRRAVPGTVEGWSFSKDRTAESSPPPGATPPPPVGSGPPPTLGKQTCPSEVPPTTTTTRRPPPTTATTSPPAGPAGTSPTSATPGPGSTGGTGSSGAGPGGATPTSSRAGSTAPATAGADGGSGDGTGSDGSTTAPDRAAGDGDRSDGDDRARTDRREEALAASTRPTEDTGSPAGLLVGLGLVVALGGAAALVTRGRRREGSSP